MPPFKKYDSNGFFLLNEETNGLFLNKKKGTLIIDERSFDRGVATFVEDRIDTYFFFDFFIWDDKPQNATKVPFRSPMVYSTYPSEIVEKNINGEKYYYCRYTEKDVVIKTLNIERKNDYLAKLFDIMLRNAIPKHIPYQDIAIIFSEGLEAFSFKGNSADSNLELLVSQFCRNPDKIVEEYRMYHKNDFDFRKANQLDRLIVPLEEISGFIPFSAAGAPHTRRSLGYAINHSGNSRESPIEQIVRRSNQEGTTFSKELERINKKK